MSPITRADRAERGSRKAGLLAGLLAMALLWAASRAAPGIPFPPLSLSERLVRATPGDVATFSIERLERIALPALSAGVTAAFLALSAFLPRPDPGLARPALAAGTLFGAALAAASFADPVAPATTGALAGAAGAGAVYGLTLAWLTELLALARSAEVDRARRRALAAVGSAAAGIALGGTLLGRLVPRLGGPNTAVALRTPDEPAELPQRGSFPRVAGLSPNVTPTPDHYVVDIDSVDPAVEAVGWTLRVHGMVDHPLELTFKGLQARFRLVEKYSVLTCISNELGGPLVGNSRWTGVQLQEVLAAARPHVGTVDVVFRCADGYSASIPHSGAMQPSVLLAIAQNGRPLTQEHGFPCRVRAPALYGIKNAKWLNEIELVGYDQRSYWTARGWTDAGVVRTESRIDTPRAARRGEPTWIAGVAWAGARGIRRVEVSADAGRSWRDARLNQPVSALAWTQWAIRWTPRAGGTQHLVCRATDGEGRVQERRRRRPHPSGASGWHEVDVEVA